MEFLPEDIDNYVRRHTEPEPEYLYDLNRATHLKVLQPRMLSGHLQGRVLSMLSHMIRPKRVLEIGTYTGYAALCLAEGLAVGGALHTIDINEELEEMVREFVGRSPYADQIHFHIGNALDIVPGLDGDFDLVFIDADKTNYANYYDLLIDRLPSGAYLIADNVLWSGKVLDKKELESDPDTAALAAFNEKIHADDRVQNVLFPVRDGLMIIRKK